MSSDFAILNLDKRQRLFSNGGKLGNSIFRNSYMTLFSLLRVASLPEDSTQSTGSWAGDRIIILGRSNDQLPAGLLTGDEIQGIRRQGLYSFAATNYGTQVTLDPPIKTPQTSSLVLRNLSKRQYACFDTLKAKDNFWDYYVTATELLDILVSQFCWCQDSTTVLGYHIPIFESAWPMHRGTWAGDRFDIVASRDFQDCCEGWEDVSAVSVLGLIDILRRFPRWGDIGDPSKARYIHVQKSTNTPFPPCNLDVQRQIMELAAENDITDALSLMLVSKLVNFWTAPIAYKSVILEKSYQITAFCETLQSNSKFGTNVRQMAISALTSHEQWNVIMSTLSNCPNLECLITDTFLALILSEVEVPPALRQVIAIPNNIITPFENFQVFHNLTHLCIDDTDLQTVASLPTGSFGRLTHFAVFCHLNYASLGLTNEFLGTIIKALLELYPAWRVLLLISCHWNVSKASITGNDWAELAQIEDSRLFARRGLSAEEWQDIKKSGSRIFDDVENKYAGWRHQR